MFRTDPLTDDGKVDMDFFRSHKYVDEQNSLIDYLYTEGFDEKTENFIIDYRSRRWHIIITESKRKRK
jgi:hypothetical protein